METKYVKHFLNANKFITKEMLNYLFEEDLFLNNYIKEKDYVADLGSGWGRSTLNAAIKVGPKGKVYGFDIDNLAYRRAKKLEKILINVTILNKDITSLSFKNYFDKALLTWNILGNIKDNYKKIMLKKAIEIVKNNGYILGSVYSENAFCEQIKQYILNSVNKKDISWDENKVYIKKLNFFSERFNKKKLVNIFTRYKEIQIKEIKEISNIGLAFALKIKK